MLRCLLLWLSLALACAPGRAGNAVPPEAVAVLRQIHTASAKADWPALRRLMVDDFRWSFGGDASAEQAIREWQAQPAILKSLHRVTGQRCGWVDAGLIQCPRQSGGGYRAGFERKPEGWRMVYFLAGD